MTERIRYLLFVLCCLLLAAGSRAAPASSNNKDSDIGLVSDNEDDNDDDGLDDDDDDDTVESDILYMWSQGRSAADREVAKQLGGQKLKEIVGKLNPAEKEKMLALRANLFANGLKDNRVAKNSARERAILAFMRQEDSTIFTGPKLNEQQFRDKFEKLVGKPCSSFVDKFTPAFSVFDDYLSKKSGADKDLIALVSAANLCMVIPHESTEKSTYQLYSSPPAKGAGGLFKSLLICGGSSCKTD